MSQQLNDRAALFFSGYKDSLESRNDQHAVLLLLLSLAVAVSVIFSVINYLHLHYWLSYVQVAVALASMPLLMRGIKKRWMAGTREILMVLAFFSFSALFVDGGIGNTGIYWALLFPFLAFLLSGVRAGWLWILTFILVHGSFLLLHGLDIIDLVYDHDTLNYVPSMFFLFAIIACSFQLQQEKRQSELNRANREQLEIENKLREAHQYLEETVLLRTEQLQMINRKLSQEVDEKIEALQQKEFAEFKFEQAQKMESLGTLVGGIAHDFNNMLSGITANLYLIQRQVTSTDALSRLDKVGELVMHAAEMIRQLMTFARKDQVELADFDMRSFLNEAFKLARVSIPGHIRCELALPDEKQCIKGDGTQIQQVLMNLINNARDALEGVAEPFINVSLTRSNKQSRFLSAHKEAKDCEYLVLTVQDNGCGIEEDTLARIFEPFYTTKVVGKGTGLGLSMVFGAVQNHGGLIDLVSFPDTGTRFSIYFPLIQDVGYEQLESADSIVEAGRGETILLVDDDLILLEVCQSLLCDLEYQVIIAVNGLEAVQAYKEHMNRIDLIMMDLVMPVMGGKSAAERIKTLNPEAKIIFTTGYDRDQDLTSVLVDDWNNVLKKPIKVDELSRALRRCLNL